MTRSVILNRSCQSLASFQKPKNMESQLVHPVRGRLRPLQENAWKCAIPNDEVENLPRMDSALGVLLDGNAVKPFFFGGFYPRSRKVYGYEILFQRDKDTSAGEDAREPAGRSANRVQETFGGFRRKRKRQFPWVKTHGY